MYAMFLQNSFLGLLWTSTTASEVFSQILPWKAEAYLEPSRTSMIVNG